jgi:hypothetical protein
MNLGEMQTKLRRQIGQPSLNAVPDLELTEHLNGAYRDISNKYRFHQVRRVVTFNTIALNDRYNLPSDCASIMRLRDATNEVKLEKWDDRRFSGRKSAAIPGKPQFYLRNENYVQLVPTPDAVLVMELKYKAVIAGLVSVIDVPTLPLTWHEGIVRLARFKYFEDATDLPKAKAAWDLWQAWLADQPIEVDEEKTDFDSGVSVPTLEGGLSPRLDFNHED